MNLKIGQTVFVLPYCTINGPKDATPEACEVTAIGRIYFTATRSGYERRYRIGDGFLKCGDYASYARAFETEQQAFDDIEDRKLSLWFARNAQSHFTALGLADKRKIRAILAPERVEALSRKP